MRHAKHRRLDESPQKNASLLVQHGALASLDGSDSGGDLRLFGCEFLEFLLASGFGFRREVLFVEFPGCGVGAYLQALELLAWPEFRSRQAVDAVFEETPDHTRLGSEGSFPEPFVSSVAHPDGLGMPRRDLHDVRRQMILQ